MKHPNRLPFEGILTKLDEPSDKAPAGAMMHRVLLTTAAAEEAIPSLIGMAVGYVKSWDNHDPRQKVGVITEAWIDGPALMVRGYLYGWDFPDVAKAVSDPNAALGLSYEMCEARVQDTRDEVWVLTRVIFSGAAILLANKAAYTSTTFRISAAADRFTGKLCFVGEGSVRMLEEEDFVLRLS